MNLPNKLTLLRIIMILPFLLVLYLDVPGAAYIALAIFILASLTDFLDGYLARKNNLVTTFGKFADPIADKLLVTTMYILFAAQGTIPVVPVLIMVARDTIVDGIRMIASSEIKISVIIAKQDADRAVAAVHEAFFQ
mgnify:CR=1 FL=1